MKNRKITLITFGIIVLLMFAFLSSTLTSPQICEALDIYKMLNDDIVEWYESQIAGEKIVSQKSPAQLERLASSLNVSLQKLKALLLLQDISARLGENASLNDLASMKDFELLKFAQKQAKAYASTLPKEQAEDLKSQLLALIKR